MLSMKVFYAVLGLLVFSLIYSSCGDKEESLAQLDLNFKIEYDGQPLILLNEYAYPDGRKINFSRFSFYLSSISLIDDQGLTTISDVEYVNTSSNLVDESSSAKGTTIQIPDVPLGEYERIQFNFGLHPGLNSMIPSDFPADHPCARPAEYWIAWDSYIFTKIEGNVDVDNNGTLDNLEGMSLHIGSDEVLETILIENPMTLQSGDQERLEMTIDIKDVFIQDGKIYDIEAAPQIHSLSQIAFGQELANNLVRSVSLN